MKARENPFRFEMLHRTPGNPTTVNRVRQPAAVIGKFTVSYRQWDFEPSIKKINFVTKLPEPVHQEFSLESLKNLLFDIDRFNLNKLKKGFQYAKLLHILTSKMETSCILLF